MTGNKDAKQRSDPSLTNMDGYQSDISLTSTVEDNDSDREWDVDDVIAVDDEYPKEKGGLETRYLVLWTGYDLGDGTWEPEVHLDSELLQQWKERKARQDRGEEPKFDVQLWYDAKFALDKAKLERHHERNAKRQRLGLVLTEPIEKEEEEFDPILSYGEESESSDEAAEEDIIDKVNDILPATATPVVKPVQRPGIFKGLPAQSSAAPKKRTLREETRRSTSTARPAVPNRNPNTGRAKPPKQSSRPQDEESSATPKKPSCPQDELPSTTGYQGTARKSSSTNISRPPPAPSQSRSSFAAKFGGGKKILTAKRSIKPAPFTGNVFVSGKTRKPKQKLGEAMVDPSKEPKAFRMRRIERKAELQSRSKADAAVPDISRIASQLFDPKQGPPPKKSSRDTQAPRNGSQSRTGSVTKEIPSAVEGSTSFIMQPDGQGTAQEAVLPKENEPPKQKPRKSVRFFQGDDSLFVDEPMQIDSVTPSSDGMSPRETGLLPLSNTSEPSNSMLLNGDFPTSEGIDRPARLSVSRPQPIATQALGKTLVVGAGKTKTRDIRVTFNGLPRDPGILWVSDFQCLEKIVISHECFAKTFLEQFDFSQTICGGTITSDEPITEQVADHLRVNLSGLFYSRPFYNLILYPTKCDDWRKGVLDSHPTSPDGVALKYTFFSSHIDLGPVLRPPLQLGTNYAQGEWKAEDSVRQVLFRKLFALEYQDLMSQRSVFGEHRSTASKSQQAFYLAFPPAKRDLCKSIFAGVREIDSDCKVFTTYQEGAWIAFLHAPRDVKCTILVHETLVWTVRHFPDLHSVLRNPNITVWCFSESLQARPLYPSQVLAASLPGTMSFTHLFPKGHVILLTPSFLVSEPENTKSIFDWYIKYKIDKPTYKLVTAWNIQQYLHTLALDKAKQRASLTDDREMKETKKECSVRFETAAIVSDKFLVREERASTYSIPGEDGPLIYADECIDANDEQSLVNWFGWWSTLRSDQYRHFYVIGSKPEIIKSTSTKGLRQLTIPRYASSRKSNLDAIHDNSRTKSTDGHGRKTGILDQSSQIRSILLNDNDYASLFSNQLARLDRVMPLVRVYGYPVSWADLPMADHFGDPTEEFKQISNWLSWVPPWNKNNYGKRCGFNTYVGFFYTISDDWNPALFPKGHKAKRHPWVAIYRPVNPHLGQRIPYTKSEVIIWDMSAGKRFGTHDEINERDLPYMQRQLIKYLRQHGTKKNPHTPLHQAFLGGFQLPDSPSPFPIDVTFAYLEELIPHIKSQLDGNSARLLREGYKRVILDSDQSSTGSVHNAQSSDSPLGGIEDQPEPMDGDHPEDDSDDDQSKPIVFHPPNSTQKSISGMAVPSKNYNDLYETARLARLRNQKATTMEYTYKPTSEWYEQQKSEGRGFEHIHIGDSETIFRVLGVKRNHLAGV